MKKSFSILKRDLLRLFKNPVAMIVMVGVCILPSLYAWFNIAANMDPYGNTKGIQVAIVNNDSGYTYDKMHLNAGKTVVKNLKKNDKLGWRFVSKDKAIQGVKSGDYYAAIIIQPNFSQSLLSITSGKPITPKLSYYINEKKNAIAPKITDTGAGTIRQQINESFSAAAGEAISTIISSTATDLTGDLSSASNDLIQSLSQIQLNLKQYQSALSTFQKTVQEGTITIDKNIQSLDKIAKMALSTNNVMDNAENLLNTTRHSTANYASSIGTIWSNGRETISSIYADAARNIGTIEGKIATVQGTVDGQIQQLNDQLAKNRALLSSLEEKNGRFDLLINQVIAKQIDALQKQNQSIQEYINALNTSNQALLASIDTAKTYRTQMEALVKTSQASLLLYGKQYYSQVLPQLNQSLDQVALFNGVLKGAITDVDFSIHQLQDILRQLKKNLTNSANTLSGTWESLQGVDTQLQNLITDLQVLQTSKAFSQLSDLKSLPSQEISHFLSSPVTISSETLYPIKNYGSSMTPFYTNLALWVGGMVLIAILKLEVDQKGHIGSFSVTQAYFGRWLLLQILGQIQGLIVCLGDLYLLKVQCLHPVAFVLTGMFCSFVYINLIYALALAFKHIGKALCVLLVILQIPGSSGTFPIEMTPAFFQKLHPILPFSYGIKAMRECIAGMYGNELAGSLMKLSLFIPVGLFIGLLLRPLLLNLNRLFDLRLADTEFMLCETEGATRNRMKLSLVAKSLLRDPSMRKDMAAKAEKFESKYKKRIKNGFILILVLPLIFLVLMFSINSKLIFLILWITSIIVISVYLICVEYIHEKAREQMHLGDLSSDELYEVIKKEDTQS